MKYKKNKNKSKNMWKTKTTKANNAETNSQTRPARLYREQLEQAWRGCKILMHSSLEVESDVMLCSLLCNYWAISHTPSNMGGWLGGLIATVLTSQVSQRNKHVLCVFVCVYAWAFVSEWVDVLFSFGTWRQHGCSISTPQLFKAPSDLLLPQEERMWRVPGNSQTCRT